MEKSDPQRRTSRRDEPAFSGFIQPPAPHAGIERALRQSFDPAASVPDDLTRLLGRLR